MKFYFMMQVMDLKLHQLLSLKDNNGLLLLLDSVGQHKGSGQLVLMEVILILLIEVIVKSFLQRLMIFPWLRFLIILWLKISKYTTLIRVIVLMLPASNGHMTINSLFLQVVFKKVLFNGQIL